jgi:hypothetical protein
MNRAEILDTAKEYVTRDRAADHGDLEDNFEMIAKLWTAYKRTPFTAYEVANMMIMLKLARSAGVPGHADNWVDMAGYAACGGELATRENES